MELLSRRRWTTGSSAQRSNMYRMLPCKCYIFWGSFIHETAYHVGRSSLHLLLLNCSMTTTPLCQAVPKHWKRATIRRRNVQNLRGCFDFSSHASRMAFEAGPLEMHSVRTKYWLEMGCLHSSVDTSEPTILQSWVRIPSKTSTLFSICSWIVIIKGRN